MSTLEEADVVVVGPAPPLRGGIAAHTSRLVETLDAMGKKASAVSWRRLYPAALFPGRSQSGPGTAPDWAEAVLDTLSPPSWLSLGRRLRRSRCLVVLQWWHPVAAPALLVATAGVARQRLVVVCHNALPHERLPLDAAAARALLRRCGRIVVHGEAEARRVAGLDSSLSGRTVAIALPALLRPPASGRAQARTALEARVGTAGPVFLVAGHLRPYKGLPVVLRAWSAARRPPQARLLVLGESYLSGEDAAEIAGLVADDSSIVQFDQYVSDEDFVSCIAVADTLVCACAEATQSGTVAIAAACAVPCIVSDAGSLAEQVRVAAPGSEVVPAGDVEALAAAITGALGRARIGSEGEAGRQAPRRAAGGVLERVSEEEFEAPWRRVVEAILAPARP